MTARIPVSMPDLYESDFVLWTEKTAEQLRQKNFDDVDWENVIEESETIGRNERQAITSLLTRPIEHLLKLGYRESERERNARHWLGEIGNFRTQLEDRLETATLMNHARDSFDKAYSSARKSLIRGKVFNSNSLPVKPTFSIE
jgi:hypothetical protein